MGDSSESSKTFSEFDDDEAVFREFLDEYLVLGRDSIPSIVNHIDCFVSQCRGDASMSTVILHPNPGVFDDVREKIGQALGSLQGLEHLHIDTNVGPHGEDDGDEEDSHP